MNFIEFLGFIISLAALFFLFVKRTVEERRRRQNPEEYARREAIQEENLRKFMRSIHMDPRAEKRRIEDEKDEDEEEEYVPPPKKKSAGVLSRAAYNPPPAPTSLVRRETPSFSYDLKPSNQALSFSYDQNSYDQKNSDKYEVIRDKQVSAASKVLNGLKSPKEMLIIKEVFGPPLSMRPPQDEL